MVENTACIKYQVFSLLDLQAGTANDQIGC